MFNPVRALSLAAVLSPALLLGACTSVPPNAQLVALYKPPTGEVAGVWTPRPAAGPTRVATR